MSSCGELNLSRVGMGTVLLICGTLVYYHCAIRTYPLISLAADVLIVLLSSLCVLGLLFRFCNISVPVDPLEWEVSQETANRFAACIANVVGATESVLRVAAKGEDKKLFLKVGCCFTVFFVGSREGYFWCYNSISGLVFCFDSFLHEQACICGKSKLMVFQLKEKWIEQGMLQDDA
ncbi:hypothetical protein KP509_01G117000 [Ceratopteris richardii]|uniref:Reticulon domain-containing protein n=1 Tax=Ceratopteris richardii TaxID=49495 RepID=A0A8T2VGP9_CERRI|nr:hypothetical protein KP509_01G117000 [Ceratopteris richardii]